MACPIGIESLTRNTPGIAWPEVTRCKKYGIVSRSCVNTIRPAFTRGYPGPADQANVLNTLRRDRASPIEAAKYRCRSSHRYQLEHASLALRGQAVSAKIGLRPMLLDLCLLHRRVLSRAEVFPNGQ